MKDTMIIYYDDYRTSNSDKTWEEHRMKIQGEAAGYNVVIIRVPNQGTRVEIVKASTEEITKEGI